MNSRIWKILLLYILVITFSGIVSSENYCIECHRELEYDDGPAHLFTKDIHFQKGLACYDCHGGDPEADDMDDVRKSADFRGVPDHLEVPQFCARCHSDASYMHERNPGLSVDQLDKYKTSVHGKLLFGKKDTKTANCVSCHTAHQIGDPRMPHSSTYPLNLPFVCGSCHADQAYMAEYGIPTNQLDLYKESVHGKALLENRDLGAPVCNDCHGNHGAAPPGIASLSFVCGQCHALEAELFENSPHYEAFLENDFSMCESCHGYHGIDKPDDSLIDLNEPGVCGNCHDIDDGTRAPMVIDTLRTIIGKLSMSSSAAEEALQQAVKKGMMTTDEEFLMKDVVQTLINVRAAVHAFNPDSLTGHAEEGIAKAEQVSQASAGLIDEYHFRRKGLAVSTILITIMAIALYLKIRSIER